ncbi:MAG: hypothetical protein ACKOBG_00395 [Actinomycetota bacterium]
MERIPPPAARQPSRPPGSGTERHLRRLLRADEQLRAWSRAWVSTEGPLPRLLTARTLDHVVLTDDHLLLYSTGFFSRLPRRRVYAARLAHLAVAARGPRRIAVWTKGRRPLLLEFRRSTDGPRTAALIAAAVRSHSEGSGFVPTAATPTTPSTTEERSP